MDDQSDRSTGYCRLLPFPANILIANKYSMPPTPPTNNDHEDPLIHLMHNVDTTLLPEQQISVQNQVLRLSFQGCDVNLLVDASPGCGGIAWPAGQVHHHLVSRAPLRLTVIIFCTGSSHIPREAIRSHQRQNRLGARKRHWFGRARRRHARRKSLDNGSSVCHRLSLLLPALPTLIHPRPARSST